MTEDRKAKTVLIVFIILGIIGVIFTLALVPAEVPGKRGPQIGQKQPVIEQKVSKIKAEAKRRATSTTCDPSFIGCGAWYIVDGKPVKEWPGDN